MRTALIVDDEKKVRDIYKRFLAQEKFTVSEAENGQQAAAVLSKAGVLDLVLLDIQMPVLCGVLVFELIKMRHPEAKVIVASVCSVDDQRRLIGTADGYFDKSQGIEILLTRIRSVLMQTSVDKLP
jgi:DNA-binding response OmpR family regulator